MNLSTDGRNLIKRAGYVPFPGVQSLLAILSLRSTTLTLFPPNQPFSLIHSVAKSELKYDFGFRRVYIMLYLHHTPMVRVTVRRKRILI